MLRKVPRDIVDQYIRAGENIRRAEAGWPRETQYPLVEFFYMVDYDEQAERDYFVNLLKSTQNVRLLTHQVDALVMCARNAVVCGTSDKFTLFTVLNSFRQSSCPFDNKSNWCTLFRTAIAILNLPKGAGKTIVAACFCRWLLERYEPIYRHQVNDTISKHKVCTISAVFHQNVASFVEREHYMADNVINCEFEPAVDNIWIFVDSTLTGQWRDEMSRFFPHVDIHVLEKKKDVRGEQQHQLTKSIVIIPADICRAIKSSEFFKQKKKSTVAIFDEYPCFEHCSSLFARDYRQATFKMLLTADKTCVKLNDSIAWDLALAGLFNVNPPLDVGANFGSLAFVSHPYKIAPNSKMDQLVGSDQRLAAKISINSGALERAIANMFFARSLKFFDKNLFKTTADPRLFFDTQFDFARFLVTFCSSDAEMQCCICQESFSPEEEEDEEEDQLFADLYKRTKLTAEGRSATADEQKFGLIGKHTAAKLLRVDITSLAHAVATLLNLVWRRCCGVGAAEIGLRFDTLYSNFAGSDLLTTEEFYHLSDACFSDPETAAKFAAEFEQVLRHVQVAKTTRIMMSCCFGSVCKRCFLQLKNTCLAAGVVFSCPLCRGSGEKICKDLASDASSAAKIGIGCSENEQDPYDVSFFGHVGRMLRVLCAKLQQTSSSACCKVLLTYTSEFIEPDLFCEEGKESYSVLNFAKPNTIRDQIDEFADSPNKKFLFAESSKIAFGHSLEFLDAIVCLDSARMTEQSFKQLAARACRLSRTKTSPVVFVDCFPRTTGSQFCSFFNGLKNSFKQFLKAASLQDLQTVSVNQSELPPPPPSYEQGAQMSPPMTEQAARVQPPPLVAEVTDMRTIVDKALSWPSGTKFLHYPAPVSDSPYYFKRNLERLDNFFNKSQPQVVGQEPNLFLEQFCKTNYQLLLGAMFKFYLSEDASKLRVFKESAAAVDRLRELALDDTQQ